MPISTSKHEIKKHVGVHRQEPTPPDVEGIMRQAVEKALWEAKKQHVLEIQALKEQNQMDIENEIRALKEQYQIALAEQKSLYEVKENALCEKIQRLDKKVALLQEHNNTE